jgi:hypothetical protein
MSSFQQLKEEASVEVEKDLWKTKVMLNEVAGWFWAAEERSVLAKELVHLIATSWWVCAHYPSGCRIHLPFSSDSLPSRHHTLLVGEQVQHYVAV